MDVFFTVLLGGCCGLGARIFVSLTGAVQNMLGIVSSRSLPLLSRCVVDGFGGLVFLAAG